MYAGAVDAQEHAVGDARPARVFGSTVETSLLRNHEIQLQITQLYLDGRSTFQHLHTNQPESELKQEHLHGADCL